MASQNFLKMANIFGPEPQQDERFGDMPTRLPMNPMSPPLVNQPGPYQTDTRGTLDQWMPPDQRADMIYQTGEDTELMDAFRRSVLNPPQRTQMTYPKGTLNTLDAALKIAAEPSPTEKNRVYVNGHAYQKQRVMYDPVTGEQKFITNVKDPSFMEQVTKAMAAGGTGHMVDILNQPYQDEVADFKLRNEAMKDAVTAEGLSQQRRAQAQIGIPSQATARLRTAEAALSRASTAERLSLLKDLTDSERLELLHRNKISENEFRDSAAMARVREQQAGATERTRMQETGATGRTQMQQSGATARSQAAIGAANMRNQANITSREKIAAMRGAPGSQSETQQRIGAQRKVAELSATNPELAEAIEFDERGFPIVPDDTDPVIAEQIYDAIYGDIQGDIQLPAPPTAVTPSGQVAPIGTPQPQMAPGAGTATPPKTVKPTTTAKPQAAAPQVIKQYSESRNQTRISTDGGKTWKYLPGRQ